MALDETRMAENKNIINAIYGTPAHFIYIFFSVNRQHRIHLKLDLVGVAIYNTLQMFVSTFE